MNKSTPNILIIDDNPSNIDFLLGLLTQYDISAAIDGERALDQIEQEIPDLILLDVNMPDMDGYEVCSIIKSNPKTKDIPILFLSGSSDSASVVKGFDVGGVDYITKPYHAKEIQARVATHLKLKGLMDDLERLAYEDPMTGIANRRGFFEDANSYFEEVESNNLSLYLCVIDIDVFKTINDTFGHDVGDEVIKIFVAIAKKELSEDDCIARFGGDEFVMILKYESQEIVLELLSRIQNNIAKTHVLLGVEVNFSVSMGVSEIESSDKTIDTMIKRADINLYREKRSKRKYSRSDD